MDFSGITERIRKLKTTVQNAKGSVPKEKAEKIIEEADINKSKYTKNVLTRETFEDILEGYAKCPVEDLEVGDFIRYKQNKGGKIRYIWGGLLIHKNPAYLRVKNVKNGITWSVQLQNPDVQHVFYAKKKQKLEEGGTYVNIDTASSAGLLATVIDRGDVEMLEKAAKLARRAAIDNSLAW